MKTVILSLSLLVALGCGHKTVKPCKVGDQIIDHGTVWICTVPKEWNIPAWEEEKKAVVFSTGRVTSAQWQAAQDLYNPHGYVRSFVLSGTPASIGNVVCGNTITSEKTKP